MNENTSSGPQNQWFCTTNWLSTGDPTRPIVPATELDTTSELLAQRAEAERHDVLVWGPASEGDRTASGRTVSAGWVWSCSCGAWDDGYSSEERAEHAADVDYHHSPNKKPPAPLNVPPPCEHHWVSTHQPDFPAPIYWIDICSQCGSVNAGRLKEQLTELDSLRAERDRAREECGHEKAMRAYVAEELSRWIKRHQEAEQERDEARQWARHGYEIGQRSCTWSDHGVAPKWLTIPAADEEATR